MVIIKFGYSNYTFVSANAKFGWNNYCKRIILEVNFEWYIFKLIGNFICLIFFSKKYKAQIVVILFNSYVSRLMYEYNYIKPYIYWVKGTLIELNTFADLRQYYFKGNWRPFLCTFFTRMGTLASNAKGSSQLVLLITTRINSWDYSTYENIDLRLCYNAIYLPSFLFEIRCDFWV